LCRFTGRGNGAGNVTGAGRDAAGRRVTVTDPNGGATTSTYNAGGQLIAATDPLGQVTTYVYS
jgi:YD repeat-containing protein